MRRTLLVTNDFPPRPGGIQSYLYELAGGLPPDRLVVFTSTWDGPPGACVAFDAKQPFPVIRHPSRMLLPTPSVIRQAGRILRDTGCSAAWFGAAAPLAVMAPALRRAGARRVLACAHGHEIGWSMLPGARSVLGRIGRSTDVVTFVSRYARSRFASAFGAHAALEYLPSGIDTDRFRPDPVARAAVRARLGLGERPVLLCVSRLVPRKGQDTLIRALPLIRREVPDAVLLLVGSGPYEADLRALARAHAVTDQVVLTGSVDWADLPAHYAAADVFAMPCRTRAGGLDVEGLGIVNLEAAAAGLPVVTGDAGGARETVLPGRTGWLVTPTDVRAVARACAAPLADRGLATRIGAEGRRWMRRDWSWDELVNRFRTLLDA